MSPYTVLGIEQGAAPDEVKKAYRRLVKEYHPDRNPGDDTAASRFREVQEAYEQINNPQQQAHTPHFRFTTIMDAMLEVSIETAFHGGKAPMTLHSPFGDMINLEVDVPPMTIHGTRLRVNGLPEQLQSIDLYIVVLISDRGRFKAMGSKIVTHVDVDFVTAILGGEIQCETMDGPRYFNVPAGTQHGHIVKFAELGFLVRSPGGAFRDEFVVVLQVTLPATISEDKRKLLEQYRSIA